MAKKIRYLVQRDSGFYARIVVPVALQPMLGKKQIWAPVHATSRATAIRKLPAVVAAMQSEIDGARAETKAGRLQASPPRRGRSLSPRQLAVAHYDGQVAFDTELRNSDDRFSHGFVDMDYVTALRSVVTGAASNQDMLDTIGGFVNKYERSGNFNAEFGTPAWREAVRALAVAELESLARTAERDEGDFTGQPANPLLTAQPEQVVAKDALAIRIIDPDNSTKTLSEILPDFIKERKPSDRSAKNYKVTVQLFEEISEEDKPVYRITRADVLKFKRALQELPSNRTKHVEFDGLTALQIIRANKARATPFPLLDANTINNTYLGGLRSLFNWCFENQVIPDNPAGRVKVDVTDTGEPRRINFSPSDLVKIFSTERFDTGKPFNERQWAELISLFGGMRASELAQIKLDSVRHERGILVFAIEEKTKNVGSLRLVPVHSTLLGLGLEKHVGKLRARSATHLFPNWYQKGEAKKDWSAFLPDAFNVTTKKNLGINDSRKTWHSFRHSFKTGLARAGVPRSMQDDLCGHSDSSAGAGYVHGESVEAMKEAIEKLRFDGFGLGAVISAE